MNKEECKKALLNLWYRGSEEDYQLINQLIDEYFDMYEKYITLKCDYGDMQEYYELRIENLGMVIEDIREQCAEYMNESRKWQNKYIELLEKEND